MITSHMYLLGEGGQMYGLFGNAWPAKIQNGYCWCYWCYLLGIVQQNVTGTTVS